MTRFRNAPARPRSQSARPYYPRLLSIGLIVAAAACGGTVVEQDAEQDTDGTTGGTGGTAGYPVSAGMGGSPYEPDASTGGTAGYPVSSGSGGSPYEPDASPGGMGGTGGVDASPYDTGVGGTGGPGVGGSAGGGVPDTYEDAGTTVDADPGAAGTAGTAGAAGSGEEPPFESGE